MREDGRKGGRKEKGRRKERWKGRRKGRRKRRRKRRRKGMRDKRGLATEVQYSSLHDVVVKPGMYVRMQMELGTTRVGIYHMLN